MFPNTMSPRLSLLHQLRVPNGCFLTNQPTTIIFVQGKPGTGERFAFDNMQVDDNFDKFYQGDPGKNSSYFCYLDTLYAEADGIVVACSDTMTENDGNQHNHLNFKAPIDYAGNSDAPHLHFEIGDAPDFFICNGLPFVLRKFTKIGENLDPTPIAPVIYNNIMNEQTVVMSFD